MNKSALNRFKLIRNEYGADFLNRLNETNRNDTKKGSINKYTAIVAQLYQKAMKELVQLGTSLGWDGKKPFYFDDFPAAKNRLNKILQKLFSDINVTIANGQAEEWLRADTKNDAIIKKLFRC